MVQAVDDVLSVRIERLSIYLEAEFGHQFLNPGEEPKQGRLLGEIEQVDPQLNWLVIHGTTVHLTSQTRFQVPLHLQSLRVGQYVVVVAERNDDQWNATRIVPDKEFQAELQVELREYAVSLPEGDLTQMRTVTGQPLLPAGARNGARALIPWQQPSGEKPRPRTVEAERGSYRVLSGAVRLGSGSYQMQVASSLAPVAATQRRLLSGLLWAVPAGLILSLYGGYLISRAALRPVERIVGVASRIDVNRLSERLEVPPTGDVIERLAGTFNAMLDRLDSSVKRLEGFTADASHELRSPVAVIRTTAELALRQGRSEEELRQDMREVQDEANRLTELIEDLLTLARTDGGPDASPMTDVDLGALVRDVAGQYGRTMGARELQVEVEETETIAKGYAGSLRRLLVILLDNAIQHTPAGTSIRVAVRGEAKALEVSVADTGGGISPEHVKRLFDRFYRVDPSRNRSNGGFGLGLSIAKWIVESHGGHITVGSQVGKGTKFSAWLPRHGRPSAG
jgi:heavy metal sensor kinase